MAARRRRPPAATRARGAALIILMALLSMGVLYFIVLQLEAVSQYQKDALQGGGRDSLAQAREALLGYATTYRDTNPNEVMGYLPCPDTTGDGVADTGDPACGSAGNASVGLLPYKTLGLPDLRDSAGGCLWYAVSGGFKATLAKPTPMNWDTQGQFRVRDASGATLVAPDDAQGGAAAVVFAAGSPVVGQNRSASATEPCRIDPSQVAAYLDGSYNFASSAPIALTQGPVKDISGSVTNNDRMAWVTPKEIFDRVVKRQDFSNPLTASPPGQVNKLTDEIKAVLEKKIQDDLVAGTTTISDPTANPGTFTQFTGKLVGTLPTTMTLNDGNYTNYYVNWSPSYRQAVCSNLGTPCLTVAGTACRGALMFSGRGDGGRPRTAAEQAYSTANLDAYFEAGSGREILNSTASVFAGKTTYSDTNPACAQPAACTDAEKAARRSLDVGACLFPGEFKSFAQDIVAFAAGVTYSGTQSASVDSGAKTVTLGDNTGGGPGAGCVWHSTPLTLNTSMRLYFRLQYNVKGNGFALALADGATNLAPNYWPRPQIMCGAADSASLGYAGSPSTSTPGIEKPKLGIEFDTLYSASRNDPPGDHMAFVYWGTTTDTDGSDDNTHYLGNGGVAVTNAAWAGGTATLTTATAHGFTTGQAVLVSGIVPSGYNGTITVSGTTAKQIRYAVASDPNAYSSGGQAEYTGVAVTNASWAGSVATLTTASPHGFAAGHTVVVSGMAPGGYDGSFTVTTATASQFSYALASNPGSYTSGGLAAHTGLVAVTSKSWAGGVATLTTASPHGFALGQVVLVSGLSPSGYNGAATISDVTASQFSYVLATNPNTSASGGQAKAVSTASAPRNPRVATAFLNAPLAVTTASYNLASQRASIFTSTKPSDSGISAGTQVIVSGVDRTEYNGTFKVTSVVNTPPYKFRYAYFSSSTIPDGTGGTYTKVAGSELSALSWALGGVVTASTAPVAHGLTVGQNITTFGMTPNGFGTTGNVSVEVDSTTFKFPLAADPDGSFSTEVPAGMARVKTADTHLPYSSFPTATSIYVRLDLTRRYDTTNQVALLDMKAYIGSSFPLGDACTQTEFENLSRDLSALCPSRSVTLQQDSIPIKALATVSAATWSSGTVSASTAAAHGLTNGARITISGATPITYNGTFVVTVTGANTFTYAVAADPGTYVSGSGSIEPLSSFYLGFTNGRGSSNAGENQSITIYNLLMRSQ